MPAKTKKLPSVDPPLERKVEQAFLTIQIPLADEDKMVPLLDKPRLDVRPFSRQQRVGVSVATSGFIQAGVELHNGQAADNGSRTVKAIFELIETAYAERLAEK